MNNARRKQIDALVSTVQDVLAQLGDIKDAEQEAFDALPEGLQNSERGEQSSAAVSSLENAINDLESVESALEEAKQ